MIQRLIPYIILGQMCVGLFHAGIGIEEWRNTGIYDSQTLFLLALAVATLIVYIRLRCLTILERSFSIIFQHAAFIGTVAWFFYEPWGASWEVFLVFFIFINLIISIVLRIVESQFHISVGGGNWDIPDMFWRLGSLLTLINTITIPLIFIFSHESLSSVWLFFGLNWLFLWKEE
ncbi:hypothetical protein KA057_01660 [Candidatus Gracilibacteria bacterium]|nr:hypothetical protein [Candidatus Gracilibacteria bacterium]